MQELFANNAITTLAAGITSTATTINLASGTGALFPNPTPGSQFFRLSLTDAATKTNHEICYCTARSGDVLTVTRNAEQVPNLAFPSSTGAAWTTGDIAANEVTAGMMVNAYNPSNDQANIVRYGVDFGTTNAYAVSLNPSLATPTQAAEIIFKPINTNTGASTLATNGGTAYAILAPNGTALTGGEIQANGLVKAIFNATLGAWLIEFSFNSATLAFNTFTVNNPTLAAQVANKAYVDAAIPGIGQTMQDVTVSRAIGTVYTSPARVIFVIVGLTVGSGSNTSLVMNGVTTQLAGNSNAGNIYQEISFLVPPNTNYELINVAGGNYFNKWCEIR